MHAYKFLAPGAIGMFSGFSWPTPSETEPGAWVEARGALESCGNGIHACRPRDLPFWLAEELWRVELGGEVLELERGVVARRGRLLGLVESWTAEAARELADECSRRSGDLAEAALAASGIAAEAIVAGLAEDTSAYAAQAAGGDVAWASCTAYVGAFTAGLAACGTPSGARGDPAYLAERRWQADWLARRLGLVTATTSTPACNVRTETADLDRMEKSESTMGQDGSDWLSCRELIELVTDYFEGALSTADRMRFEEHITVCPPCRIHLGQMRDTIRVLGGLTEESIPPRARDELLHAFRNWKQSG